ncbi:PREDICTED: deoxynucleoside triphosphate triphosphohydrolase SAMHD1-like [Amphimedon queenslandica]|uniref:HD domain-containing protein n=1 Tax=Amphimedon queenslandica TaxID=400682 RepID=A0AAN0JPH4_AMPQE|nr:PREDICTED: deoxynucleoside triphosphate triphosphohydrolase SAMHD1-like [Amphimedon queenslandica]|eukprot:XP_019858935.1 PREDICTED: deoxynucleoside triphosphate triphosphohydrolase SAMHD1-like [Amphimedon queenslandica]
MNLQQIEKEKAMQANSKQEIASLKEEIKALNEQLMKNKKLQASPQEKNPLIFQDDIYGGITIDHPLIREIVQTHQFQRLKDIKKLGYTYQNIPKANYSRMEHSIGMYYLAGEYVKQLQRRQPELNITESDVLCVQIAALCYNLGHGPFSHTFDMFLDAIHEKNKSGKPWKNVSEASVKMFHYMLEDNEGLMASFEKHFDNPKEDIAFIKELIQGTGYEQRKDKKFLHKIVYNKKSGLDVCMIESTVRDAAVLGMNVTFRWKTFLNQVHVLRCDDGESHKCFSKDDLEICNDLFRTRHSLHRDLYYARKSRMAAIMIRRILVKSNEIPIIKDKSRRVTISQATKSMSGYTELTDSALNNIKLLVDDPEVQVLLKCLNTMKVIGQIGYVTPTDEWNEDKITQHIVQSIRSCDISNELIIDPTKHGYENWNALTQYYYTSDGRTGQWTHEWAQPPPSAAKQLRIFLVSGDKDLIKEVQGVLRELIRDEQLIPGDIYPDEENYNLMPQVPPLKKEEATELKEEVASALATV